MNSKQLKEQDILQWACQYLPSQRVFNMEFQDGQLISELIFQFCPSIRRLNYCNLKPKMILSLGYIKDFLRDHKIPIDFDVHKVASQSQQDILKLLYDIRQHFEYSQEQNPQKKKLQNLVKQADNGRNGQPSPIRNKEKLQQSSILVIDNEDIWYPPSENKSIPRQRQSSIGALGPRLSVFQQYSSKKIVQAQQVQQAQSTSKPLILVEQEVTPIQDSLPQNFQQVQQNQVNPNGQNQTVYRDIIQQQIQEAANQQQEIYKVVRIVEELMAKSAHVQEFKRKVFDVVKDVISRWEYLQFHLWLDVLKQLAQPEDEYLIMAGQMLSVHLGETLSNLQIVPTLNQSLLWQQLMERTYQRTQDAQIQCHLISRSQSNYQTPNKSIISQYQNASVPQVEQAKGSLFQSPHQSVTKNNTLIGNLSPIPYDPQSSSIQQPCTQSMQQPSLSFHSITEQSSISQVQAVQQLNENSQNGLQQNVQQYIHQNGCLSESAANNGNASKCKNSPLSYVSAPTQMEQFQQIEQTNQFVLNTPKQQENQFVCQESPQQQQQYIQQTPITHRQSMYPNHNNESNRSIFQNSGYQNLNFPQQENFLTPQPQILPQIQSQSNQQRSSIFQNLFQSQYIQTPQFTEQQQAQNINSVFDERLVGVNGEKTQIIENVPTFQNQQLDNQNEQQNTNDPSNPLMIQGQAYNESQSSRGSQYNFQHK